MLFIWTIAIRHSEILPHLPSEYSRASPIQSKDLTYEGINKDAFNCLYFAIWRVRRTDKAIKLDLLLSSIFMSEVLPDRGIDMTWPWHPCYCRILKCFELMMCLQLPYVTSQSDINAINKQLHEFQSERLEGAVVWIGNKANKAWDEISINNLTPPKYVAYYFKENPPPPIVIRD